MIEVFGILGSPPADVREACAQADLVVGSRRALDDLDIPDSQRLVMGPLAPVIARLEELFATGEAPERIIVLASGDPLFYGIVRRLRTAGLSCHVHPGVSSIATAFAAVALPWDDAVVVSAHGQPLAPALAACRALPKVAVLTSPAHGIAQFAAGLADLDRWFVLAERLGEQDERIRVFDSPAARLLTEATDVAEPNVLLVLAAPPEDPSIVGSPSFFSGRRPLPHPEPGERADANDPLCCLIVGRHLPTLGDTVWVRGSCAPQIAQACARTGAAVLDLAPDLGGLGPGAAPEPDLVVLGEGAPPAAPFTEQLADLGRRLGDHRPRAIVLVTAEELAPNAIAELAGSVGGVNEVGGVKELGELEEAGSGNGQVTRERVRFTTEGDEEREAHLTTIYPAEGD